MVDLKKYQIRGKLKDGRPFLIRAIRPGDKDKLLEGFSRMSNNSIHMRFFGAKGRLNEQDLAYFSEVDFVRHVALGASIEDQGKEQLIGGGRYFEFGKGLLLRRAEIAFAVIDAYQGQGVTTLILQHLIAIARTQGIEQFVAETLIENRAMLKVFEHSGLPMHLEREGDAANITLSLT